MVKIINPRGRIIEIDEGTGEHKELLKRGFELYVGDPTKTYLPEKDKETNILTKTALNTVPEPAKSPQTGINYKSDGMVVYTAITAGHDLLKENQCTSGASFLCFLMRN